MCRSRRELSNEYLLAKIGVDAAENEPLEVLGENSIQYSLHSLGAPRGLRHLELRFSGCVQLRDVEDLGRSVGTLHGLRHLQLDFGGCRALSDTMRREFKNRLEFFNAAGL